jgi:hypothetical protein
VLADEKDDLHKHERSAGPLILRLDGEELVRWVGLEGRAKSGAAATGPVVLEIAIRGRFGR